MSNDLVGYTPRAGSLGAPTTSAAATRAQSLAGTEFTPMRELTWADMPAESARAARPDGPVVMDWVDNEDTYQRKIDGILHQERFGVLLTATRLIYARAVRPLMQDATGRYRPVGNWRHHDVLTARLTSFHQQAAHMPADVSTTTSEGNAADAPTVARELRHAESTLTYLPPRVQATVRRDSPNPTVAKGITIQISRASAVAEQTIRLLRFNAERGVLVVAYRRNTMGLPMSDRQFALLPWDVTQSSFTLIDAPAPRTLGRGARQAIGGR